MFSKNEWTQKEFLQNKKELEKKGIKVILIDTILKPIPNVETFVYNKKKKKIFASETVFVLYRDTGKTTNERLEYYKKKFPKHKCISLRGGRGYFRPNLQLLDKNE